MKYKVRIVKNNKEYNWEVWDNFNIPIYGKTFKNKKETNLNLKQFIKRNNIKNWSYETIFEKVWRYLWNRIIN